MATTEATTDQNRYEQLRAEYAERLRDVCRDFPDETFAQLVSKLAEFRTRHERRDAAARRAAPARGD